MPKPVDYTEEFNLFQRAHQAGCDAVALLQVQPMTVYDPMRKKSYYVEDGACGFAWVTIKPANSKFSKMMQVYGYARKSIYEPGIMMWVSDYNQCVQKKEAYAYAFAQVLRDAGIKASAHSRLD